MKKISVMVLSLVLGVQANAGGVSCEAVKRGDGSSIERGVKIKTDVGSFEEYVWFGADANSRDKAAQECGSVLSMSYCKRITPKASDQYMNVGDPGFGPRLYVKKSSAAGLLEISHPDYSGYQGEYHAFYEDCEETRAKLALRSAEAVQYEVRKKRCMNDGYPEWACPGLFY
jgi:hypothetical protein